MNRKDDILVELLLVFPDKTISQKFVVTKGITVGEIKSISNLSCDMKKAIKITESIAVDGIKVNDDFVVSESKRLVVLRPLEMDPKEMRRKRQNMRAGEH
tara:strand:+ start:29 stop:328 length:300 start_codon:yes stop_codon:yes gene_type:complete